MVCIIDHEQQLAAITGQRVVCGAQQVSGPAGLGDIGDVEQAAERAERHGPSRRGARHPTHHCRRLTRDERFGGSVREQRLADTVGADQYHPGCLGIVQRGRDPLHYGIRRRGNPSSRHRRILWRAVLPACQ